MKSTRTREEKFVAASALRRVATLGIVAGVLLAAALLASCGSGGSPSAPVLRCGDAGVICTVVGNGQHPFSGDGGPPEQAALYYPMDLGFDPQGRLHILDWNHQRIRRLDTDNRLRTIMGTGVEGNVQDGALAIVTPLHHTYSITFDAAGNFYLAGNHQPQILIVGLDTRVHVVAGSDTSGFDGDGALAAHAKLLNPCGVAVAPSGRPIFIADTGNHRIRVVDAHDVMSTLAGTGVPGYSGDEGPASDAQLDQPYRVRYRASTNDVFVCDTYNDAVRRIDASGIIHAVAGNGTNGYTGDGGPAASAQLNRPNDVAFAADGSVYIADTGNHCIRKIDAAGGITTVAGDGIFGFSGDGGLASGARLNLPSAIAFDADGNLWIADTVNSRVREIHH